MAADLYIEGRLGFRLPGFIAAFTSERCGVIHGSESRDLIDIIKHASEFVDVEWMSHLGKGWLYFKSPPKKSVSYMDLRNAIEHIGRDMGLGKNTITLARKALDVLALGESKHHRTPDMEQVHLHEARNALPMFLAAAYIYELFDIRNTILLNQLNYGSGYVTFSHGHFELPAPATRYICSEFGIPLVKGEVEGEYLTPTGAAFLASVDMKFLHKISGGKGLVLVGYDGPPEDWQSRRVEVWLDEHE